jgi:hypothetical protein
MWVATKLIFGHQNKNDTFNNYFIPLDADRQIYEGRKSKYIITKLFYL